MKAKARKDAHSYGEAGGLEDHLLAEIELNWNQ